MQRYFFHTVLISFVLGVAFRTVFTVGEWSVLWLFLVAVGLGVVWGKNREAISTPHLLLFSVSLFLFAVGIVRTDIVARSFNHSPLETQINTEVELTGVVTREPERREKTTYLYIQAENDTLLVTIDPFTTVSYGDEVIVKGVIERPQSFTTELGREFDYAHYLLAQGVEYRMSYVGVDVKSHDQGNTIISFLLKQKHALIDGIEMALVEPQAGLGKGLLLGVKQALGEDLEQVFRKTGIVHIIVLSGHNVMLVAAFVMFLLSFFLGLRKRTVVGIVAIICFALIVGLSATVVRASVMVCLLLVARASGRTYDMLRALLFAGAVMVFINPYLLLYDIGFQFSFMATLGLVLVAPAFETLLTKASLKIGMKEYIVATIATQIAVLPLILYYIGEVSLVAVVVNVLVLPVVAPAMLATFIAGLVSLISPFLAVPFAFVAHLTLAYIITVATWFSLLPFAVTTVPYFPVAYIGALYIIIGVVLLWWRKRQTSIVDSYADWVIEEEIEKVKGADSPPLTSIDTHILFR